MSVYTFNPNREDFNTEKEYEEYLKNSRCAICHEMKKGDKFVIRPIQTEEQAGGKTLLAVPVHIKCLNE